MTSPEVTLIGDLIESRMSTDRQELHNAVSSALRVVTIAIAPLRPLAITAGDEFQGSYVRLGDAISTVMAIRSLLEPAVRVRFGIGRGEITVLDPDANTQDGPGWWAARAAIEEVEAREDETGWAAQRVAYRSAQADDAMQDAVNAALVCQDLLLDSFDERSWSILRGMMSDNTQTQIADDLGISRQAVQQRRSTAGMPMIVSAARNLASLP